MDKRASIWLLLSALWAVVLAPNARANTPSKQATQQGAKAKNVSSFFELKPQSLNGKPYDLAQHKGKVVLVVNTASQCGYTPQYEGLEKLYEDKKDEGLVVLGFPSNDFGGQEPGTPEQIADFCTTKFGVKFPLMQKVKTKGPDQSPVYSFLSAKHGEPKWNFHKYVVGRDGQVKDAFPSKVAPESPELQTVLDAELGKK